MKFFEKLNKKISDTDDIYYNYYSLMASMKNWQDFAKDHKNENPVMTRPLNRWFDELEIGRKYGYMQGLVGGLVAGLILGIAFGLSFVYLI